MNANERLAYRRTENLSNNLRVVYSETYHTVIIEEHINVSGKGWMSIQPGPARACYSWEAALALGHTCMAA